jgi:hypothetical protein
MILTGVQDDMARYGKVYCSTICMVKIKELFEGKAANLIDCIQELEAKNLVLKSGLVQNWQDAMDVLVGKGKLTYLWGNATDKQDFGINEWVNGENTHFTVFAPIEFDPMRASPTRLGGAIRSRRLYKRA